MAKFSVKFAVFGALAGGNQDQAEGASVATQLQQKLDTSSVVECNTKTFGDPAPHNTKHFGALVERDGALLYFACQENQTIDFGVGGSPSPASTITVEFASYGALIEGDSKKAKAADVRLTLQSLINRSPVVACNDAAFGDPVKDFVKHFAAVVKRDGQYYYYACQENQTINFAKGGIPGSG